MIGTFRFLQNLGGTYVLTLLFVGIALLPSCNREQPPAVSQQSPTARQTIADLIAAHKQRAYASIEPLCHPRSVSQVITTLTAVDNFLAANDALCQLVRERVSGGAARVIDQSHFAANLDIFSAYVELHDERIDGDSAIVTYTVDGRLPVRECKLVRIDGRWRYDPGDGYDPDIPAAFQRMADGLRLVAGDLKSGRINAGNAADDPQKLIEEVRLRLMPGLQMLPQKPVATGKP